ncbi:MAG TPA: S8 family serine peptidase, partial [Thermoanaerobaculia bacterium]|nr:S8 family serine peptidase [Thermoanaerobaculia bacterium]
MTHDLLARVGARSTSLALLFALAPAAVALSIDDQPGLARLTAAYDGAALVRGVASFDAPPTAAQLAALQGLGLFVQPLRHVPLAVVFGPVATLETAVTLGFARDVYPDEPVELFDTTSSDALGAAATRAAGLTGEGVTVAVVDSGCDASHPDLADHVAHNVKLYSGEYANQRPDGSNTIVVANEIGPYQNSDVAGGHGTHVAGIIAADSTTDPAGGRLGVAPDAELVCYSIGEVLFTTAVVTAYDHLLDQPELWSVDVVNNSWGNSFRQFDPRDPVAIVTRAVADLGVVVVFAAGNSGYENAEMSLNPFSEAPWVISVAASTLDHHRGNFSSNGLVFDNSEPGQVGGGGHTVYSGDRIGVYHPDVTAPGQSISSTCSTAGTAVLACPPYGNRTASGTSMASPHVAGAAAVLRQANPALTPDEVRSALQATATPVFAGDGSDLPFWQIGFGHVDLAAAADLVRSPGNWRKALARAQAKADARVLAADGYAVRTSDFWTYDAPRLAVGGSDARTFSAPVTLGTTTEAVTGAGTASVFIDFATLGF